MNRTQKVVVGITGAVVGLAILMSILFTPASLMALGIIIGIIFIMGEGDSGNPCKRVKPGNLSFRTMQASSAGVTNRYEQHVFNNVDNSEMKEQMKGESDSVSMGGYIGLKTYVGLLALSLFVIGMAYVLFTKV